MEKQRLALEWLFPDDVYKNSSLKPTWALEVVVVVVENVKGDFRNGQCGFLAHVTASLLENVLVRWNPWKEVEPPNARRMQTAHGQ